MADPGALATALTNLLENAYKYSEETKHIELRVGADNGHVIFSVKDNGIGIDPRFQDQIFGIFKRLHTNKDYPGTGMGLAICQRVVERNGGRVWVESEPGKGSTFFFTVPDRESGSGTN